MWSIQTTQMKKLGIRDLTKFIHRSVVDGKSPGLIDKTHVFHLSTWLYTYKRGDFLFITLKLSNSSLKENLPIGLTIVKIPGFRVRQKDPFVQPSTSFIDHQISVNNHTKRCVNFESGRDSEQKLRFLNRFINSIY